MTLRLTQRGYWFVASIATVFAGSLLMAGIGETLLGPAVAGIVWANVSLIVLSVSFAETMRVAKIVKRQQLELAWKIVSDPQLPIIRGQKISVRVSFRNTTPNVVTVTNLVAIHSREVEVGLPEVRITLGPSAIKHIDLPLHIRAAGRSVLHGMRAEALGPMELFQTPMYFANPLSLVAIPKAQLTDQARRQSRHRAEDHATSRRMVRGEGTEFRELREYRSGDSFRSIAWRASAKRQKWVVKEAEEEARRSAIIAIDGLGSMRGGIVGERPIDEALDRALGEARKLLERGERIGLVVVAERILAKVSLGVGPLQLQKITRALVSAAQPIDSHVTEITDEELLARVGLYLKYQEGLRVQSDGHWDAVKIVRRARQHLDAIGIEYPKNSRTPTAMLRLFCSIRALPLPPKTPGTDTAIDLLRRALGAEFSKDHRSLDRIVLFTCESQASRQLLGIPIRYQIVTGGSPMTPQRRTIEALIERSN